MCIKMSGRFYIIILFAIFSLGANGKSFTPQSPGLYWTATQCSYLVTTIEQFQDACKRGCEMHTGCTAFVHHAVYRSCNYYKCPIPAPVPRGIQSGYVAFSQKADWTLETRACIIGNNDEILYRISLIYCKSRCEDKGWCRSLEYHSRTQRCSLSQANSNSRDYRSQCHPFTGWTFTELTETAIVPKFTTPETPTTKATTTEGTFSQTTCPSPNEEWNDHDGKTAGTCQCKTGYIRDSAYVCVGTCSQTTCPSPNEECNDNDGKAAGTCRCQFGYLRDSADVCIGCIFDSTEYRHGDIILNKYVCAQLQCDANSGKFTFLAYDDGCSSCMSYWDPHILTYDQSDSSNNCDWEDSNISLTRAAECGSFAYQKCGKFSLSQSDDSYYPEYAVYVTFVQCGGSASYTCVGTVHFKNDGNTIVSVGYENILKIQVNDMDVNSVSSSISQLQVSTTVYPVLAWTSTYGNARRRTTCVNLQGSSGFMVRYCGDPHNNANTVVVLAHPTIVDKVNMHGNQLRGLCGNANGDVYDDMKDRNNDLIPVHEFESRTRWQATATGGDGTCISKRSTRRTQNKCESNPSVRDRYVKLCEDSVKDGLSSEVKHLIKILSDDCVYDLCNVTNTASWMKTINWGVQVQAEVQKNTKETVIIPNFTTPEPSTTEAQPECVVFGTQSLCISAKFDFVSGVTAATVCAANGGRLATLNNPKEAFDYATEKYGSEAQFWVGGSDAANEGTWLWSSGQPLDIPSTLWNPSYKDTDRNCVVMSTGERYYDVPCDTLYRYICEAGPFE